MKKIACCYSTLAILMLNTHIDAQEQKNEIKASEVLCTKETLRMSFPSPIVKDILIRQKVQPQIAEEIAKELSTKDKEISFLVEQKASEMEPNPFKDLSHRDVAIKILQETIYEVFASVLAKNGLTDEATVRALLNEMLETKGRLFVECIQRENSF